MTKPWIINLVFVVLAASMYEFLEQHDVEYFEAIAEPILNNWRIYVHFLNYWFVVVGVSLILTSFSSATISPLWKDYVFVPVNSLLISSGYFRLVIRLYFFSFSGYQTLIDILPIVGVCALMLLARFSPAQVAKFNIVVLFAIAPLALQYALIATNIH